VTRIFLILSLITAWPAAVLAEPAVYIRSNGQFVAHGTEYRRSFWVPVVRDAGPVFEANFEALDEYNKHVSAGRWFSWLNWGAVGAYVLYASISSASDTYNGWAGFFIFFVPWTGGAYMLGQSNAHLLRAVNLANGVASPQAQRPSGLRIPLLAWSF
jgi:hypothetical protein